MIFYKKNIFVFSRNLKKPMAVQDKKKELYFINHYNVSINFSLDCIVN